VEKLVQDSQNRAFRNASMDGSNRRYGSDSASPVRGRRGSYAPESRRDRRADSALFKITGATSPLSSTPAFVPAAVEKSWFWTLVTSAAT
jgi:hypothetical protein